MSYAHWEIETPPSHGLHEQTNVHRFQPIVSPIVQPEFSPGPFQILHGDRQQQEYDTFSTGDRKLPKKLIGDVLGSTSIKRPPEAVIEPKKPDKDPTRSAEESDSYEKPTDITEPS